MKKIIYVLFIIFVASLNQEAKTNYSNSSYGFFYSSLSHYGEWIELDFGMIVWRPNSVHRDWRPYSLGRWNWTKHGWYWDSFEPFGWATYHYGRWYYDDYYGWIWIPDNEWGPSWVEWRYDDDYIGWAPLPPYAHFRINIGIHFSLSWHSHYSYWNFVRYDRFCSHRVNYYIVDYSRNYRIFNKTKYRTNYYMDDDRIVNCGLDRSYVERKAGYRISERNISTVDDFNNYERNRDRNGDRIISYKPSEKELEKYRDYNNDVIKSNRRSSIDNEKLVVNDRIFNTRVRSEERIVEKNREAERNFENKSDDTRNYERKNNRVERENVNRDIFKDRTSEINRKSESNRESSKSDRRIEENNHSNSSRERGEKYVQPRQDRSSNNNRDANRPKVSERNERKAEGNSSRSERSQSSDRRRK